MAKIKVVVNKLNRRKSPVLDFANKSNIVDVLPMGHEFESVGTITNRLGVWHVDRDGFFVWEREVGESTKQNSYSDKKATLTVWNNSIPQLPGELKSTEGKGVKVAVLDTGLFLQHEDLNESVKYFEDFTLVKDDIDYDGHGTHVTGIIGARSSTINGLIGTAPACELLVLKVLADEKDVDSPDNYNNITNALDTAIKKRADVINMSFSLVTEKAGASQEWLQSLTLLKAKIQEAVSKNIILVAAGGDKADIKDGKLFFPALEDGVISVAAISQGHFDRNPVVSPKLNIVAPFTNYISTYKSPSFYESLWGCSMSCAFISGIIALLIAANRTDAKPRFTKAEVLSMLAKHDLSLDKLNYNDTNNFYYHLLNLPV